MPTWKGPEISALLKVIAVGFKGQKVVAAQTVVTEINGIGMSKLNDPPREPIPLLLIAGD